MLHFCSPPFFVFSYFLIVLSFSSFLFSPVHPPPISLPPPRVSLSTPLLHPPNARNGAPSIRKKARNPQKPVHAGHAVVRRSRRFFSTGLASSGIPSFRRLVLLFNSAYVCDIQSDSQSLVSATSDFLGITRPCEASPYEDYRALLLLFEHFALHLRSSVPLFCWCDLAVHMPPITDLSRNSSASQANSRKP